VRVLLRGKPFFPLKLKQGVSLILNIMALLNMRLLTFINVVKLVYKYILLFDLCHQVWP